MLASRQQQLIEGIMRSTILILAAAALGLIAFAASSQAAPVMPRSTGGDGGPAITLIAGGCGPGFHRHRWRGPEGHWHSRCVPN
jgi:hypothetical protein